MSFTVIAFYTPEYKEVFEKYLNPSLNWFNLPYKVYEVNTLGNWKKNTCLKPLVIEKALEELKTDILYLDVDAVIENELNLEIPDEYDYACHILDWNKWYKNGSMKFEPLTGTLFFRNTLYCQGLIKQWKELSLSFVVPDGKSFEIVIKNNPRIILYNLPIEYCWINTMPNGNKPNIKQPKKIYISHNQVSRELRKNIK